jgi:hypothetical protein
VKYGQGGQAAVFHGLQIAVRNDGPPFDFFWPQRPVSNHVQGGVNVELVAMRVDIAAIIAEVDVAAPVTGTIRPAIRGRIGGPSANLCFCNLLQICFRPPLVRRDAIFLRGGTQQCRLRQVINLLVPILRQPAHHIRVHVI